MKSFSGTPLKKTFSLGILTSSQEVTPRSNYILMKENLDFFDLGYAGYISTSPKLPPFSKAGAQLHKLNEVEHSEGDIALLAADGSISIVWEKASAHNALFLTEACNAHCIMCPQPPRKHNPIHEQHAHNILDLLKTEKLPSICITGGEPTLLGKNFLQLLNRCVIEHPESQIEVLTNGQPLENFKLAQKIATICTPKVRFCVSLHADTDDLHDNIVQKDGAFGRTHRGLFNLARFGIETEIRFVISKLNFFRLPTLADFIFRTYPFINHLAVMGLEMTGDAAENKEKVWIDPVDYGQELLLFVQEAKRRRLPFSIYNHQLCTTPKEVWPYTRRAISDWKQGHAPECSNCLRKEQCGGVFMTSGTKVSRGISPFYTNS